MDQDSYYHKGEIRRHIGGMVRHFKGDFYLLVSLAECHETGETFVVYKALYGTCETYIRPFDEFCSKVDTVKYPNSTQEYRFAILYKGSVKNEK